MNSALSMRPLKSEDAAALSSMLQSQSPEYLQYFTPFEFTENSIVSILQNRQKDVFQGFFLEDELVGFFMLRGWDEGFNVPAYGVVISETHRGLGLGKCSIEISKSICRYRGAIKMMLKVNPRNTIAKHLYESMGFVRNEPDEDVDDLIYYLII